MIESSPVLFGIIFGTLIAASLIVVYLAFGAWRRVNSTPRKAPRRTLPQTCNLCMRAKILAPRRSWCRSGLCAAHCDMACKAGCARAFLKVVGAVDTLH